MQPCPNPNHDIDTDRCKCKCPDILCHSPYRINPNTCACECSLTSSSCFGHYPVFDATSCRCKSLCPQVFEIKCRQPYVWNVTTCECKSRCGYEEACPRPYTWNHWLCACYSTRGGIFPFRLLQEGKGSQDTEMMIEKNDERREGNQE